MKRRDDPPQIEVDSPIDAPKPPTHEQICAFLRDVATKDAHWNTASTWQEEKAVYEEMLDILPRLSAMVNALQEELDSHAAALQVAGTPAAEAVLKTKRKSKTGDILKDALRLKIGISSRIYGVISHQQNLKALVQPSMLLARALRSAAATVGSLHPTNSSLVAHMTGVSDRLTRWAELTHKDYSIEHDSRGAWPWFLNRRNGISLSNTVGRSFDCDILVPLMALPKMDRLSDLLRDLRGKIEATIAQLRPGQGGEESLETEDDAYATSSVGIMEQDHTSESDTVEQPEGGAIPTEDNTTRLPKEPSKEANQAYLLWTSMGITQTDVARKMSSRLGRKVKQWQVARWVGQVRAFRKANGLPIESVGHARRKTTVDPFVLDMGRRTDHKRPSTAPES